MAKRKSKAKTKRKPRRRVMAPKIILAVAVAERSDEMRIGSWRRLRGVRRMKVRPYLRGLVQGLDELGAHLGKDYVIHFRQREAVNLDENTFSNPGGGSFVIVGMSTTVVKAAANFWSPSSGQPIVGVVSQPGKEGIGTTKNLCGINAKRVQTADVCLKRFKKTVPDLTEIKVLHKAGYGPSDDARDIVVAAAGPLGITISEVPVTTASALMVTLQSLPQRDIDADPATVGVQVLPIDVCLGQAQEIIDYVQQDRGLPIFFPVPDWVRADASGAFGAYGVSQRRCGVLMAERINAIWGNGNSVPSFSTVNQRWRPADSDSFEFLVSEAVAGELNIKLDPGIPRA